MDEFDFYELRQAFLHLRHAIDYTVIKAEDERKERWETLCTALKSGQFKTQDEVFSVSLSDLLHKIMIIASANYLVDQIAHSAPGWAFVLMEIDAQIAKKKEREGGGGIQPIPTKRPAWWVPGWYKQNDDSKHGNVPRRVQP